MIRTDHKWYDLRELLGNAKLFFGLLAAAAIFVLFISFQFVYLFVLLFIAIMVARVLIGRRCPNCDGPLKEVEAERDKDSVFVMQIVWRCPRDGYEEKEKTKGDSGLFGTN